MRIKYLLSLLLCCLCSISYSQSDLIKWKTNDIRFEDNILRFNIEADINDGWYIYALDNDFGGPISLSIIAKDKSSESLPINVKEIINAEKYYDEIFDMEVKIYSKKIKIKCEVNISPEIKDFFLLLDGQACNSTDGACQLVSDKIKIMTN